MRMGSSLDATTYEQSQAKILNEADAEPPILLSELGSPNPLPQHRTAQGIKVKDIRVYAIMGLKLTTEITVTFMNTLRHL